MNMTVYLNGKFLPSSQASISVLDMAYLYGYGVFETLRVYNRVPFRLDGHLLRLADGAKFLGIERPDQAELTKAVKQLIERNRLSDGRVRITLSIEGTDIVPTLAKKRGGVLFIATTPIDVPSLEKAQRIGVKAMISNKFRRTTGGLSAIKGTVQAVGILAQTEAHSEGYDEALLLNEKGFLSEGSFSNVFVVKNGVLITPDLKSGILPGITRETVLEIAKRSVIPCQERKVTRTEAVKADEIFITNSIRELVPIVQMSGKPIANGKPGVVTRRLISAYKALVKKETAART